MKKSFLRQIWSSFLFRKYDSSDMVIVVIFLNVGSWAKIQRDARVLNVENTNSGFLYSGCLHWAAWSGGHFDASIALAHNLAPGSVMKVRGNQLESFLKSSEIKLSVAILFDNMQVLPKKVAVKCRMFFVGFFPFP